MGFPKGASLPFGQGRGQNPAREVASFIVVFLFAPLACQTVQPTGRYRFNVASESQESQPGNDAYKGTPNKQKLSQNREWQARLGRVGQRIAAAADHPEYKWEFNTTLGIEINRSAS